MSTLPKPQVSCDRHHTGIAVRDIQAAIDFYTTRLGFELGFVWRDPPEFAGLNLGEVQIFLDQREPNPEGCTMFFVVGDVDALYEYHRANGVEIETEIGDREYGLRDYSARDLYGYVLQFGQYIYTVGDPVVIERVDVPVRLEKRLAALLADLAAYKRMSVSSCLEETLLHTIEPLGDGVASPHTQGQLRYIQKLKAKHGIDYDTHASYRFVEKDA
jgi:catechol 2,3-dioxygenase-like lactoylglutathione lyase family enzyme